MHTLEISTYCTSTGPLYSAETHKNGGGARGIGQYTSISVFGGSIVIDFEITVSTCTAGMNHTFWDTFMIEAMDLLASDLVFQ